MSKFNRRKLLQAAAASTTFPLFTVAGTKASGRVIGANDTIRIGVAGINGRGSSHIGAFAGMKQVDVTYLIDPDSRLFGPRTEQVQSKGGNTPQCVQDVRRALDDPNLDAVSVATCNHWHSLIGIWACQAGKDAYVEKPISHNVYEGRKLVEAAQNYNRVVQHGTQQRSDPARARQINAIQSGKYGKLLVSKGFCCKPRWSIGFQPNEAPPAELDFNLWLGPAPDRPYAAGRYHPAQWRRWWDFGQGTLGDMACHYMDLPFWALQLRHPDKCQAEGPQVHPETCPLGLKVQYEFPERKDQPPVTLTWYDGNMIPKTVAGHRVPGSGVMFVGTEGQMFADYGRYKLYPQKNFVSYKPPKPTIPRSIGHHAEWIKACKDGSPTTCNFDYSGALTETVLLGNVAFRTGEALDWDAKKLEARGSRRAAHYIRKEYRKGWEVA